MKKCYFWVIVIIICLAGCSGDEKIEQPIAYSHQLHISEAGLECTDCHVTAKTGVKASIPNIHICADCHSEAITESADEKKLVSYIENEQKIPWIQVHQVKDYAYFSHRRHAGSGAVECRKCHGDVSTRTVPFNRPTVAITMNFCRDCHRQKKITVDCSACHR